MLFVIAICAAVGAAIAIYWKLIKAHSYWSDRGIKQGNPKFISGHNIQMGGKHSFIDMVDFVYKMYPQDRFNGIYMMNRPMLLVRDIDLIKQIAVKDFDHFTDHVMFTPQESDDIWSQNLFTLRGEKWRDMRATLSPVFTTSKMKAMFTLMSECAEQFTNHFYETGTGGVSEVELKDIYTRFGTDVIATCAFGVNVNSLRDKDNEFFLMGKGMTNMTSFRKRIRFLILMLSPKLAYFLGVKFIDKQVETFFFNLVSSTVKYREENNIVRPDMIHLLMEARNGRLQYDDQISNDKDTGFATVEESAIGKEVNKKQPITLKLMTAQALLFFFGGFDSMATLMCFCSYELAINPDIQDRLREEIQTAFKICDGQITYEVLNKMKYLDMVIAETLRKWPPGGAADRVCVKPYTIQPERPNEVPVHLKPGDGLWFPYYGIHRDPQYYPEPERFDPERFSDENKANVKPYTYFPFGVGPRNCIASRFALLEAKTLICHLLNKFELTVIDRTPIPITLVKGGFVMNAEGGFWVGIKPIA